MKRDMSFLIAVSEHHTASHECNTGIKWWPNYIINLQSHTVKVISKSLTKRKSQYGVLNLFFADLPFEIL